MSYNILLVDDDRAFREELREALEEYEIIEASDGDEALCILKKPNEIDLVLLDVMLPGKRGTEVLKEIKKISPGLSIVILTGFSTKDVAVEALKGRADDYIEKPINLDKTRALIKRLLAGKHGAGETDDLDGKIGKVKEYLARNYDKKVSLEDAAGLVYLSPKYLSRVFSRSAGMNFNDYKIKLKIEKAKEWLKNSGLSIDQISDKLGYKNPESFIRAFEKIVRRTPTQFRKGKKR